MALVMRKGLREGRAVGGTEQVPFLVFGSYLLPGLNVLPRNYIDCMSVMHICSSELLELYFHIIQNYCTSS